MKETDTLLLNRLKRPEGKIDVVLDTDTYNEIDDQFALAYLLRSGEKLNVKAIYAAPFFNEKSEGPADSGADGKNGYGRACVPRILLLPDG